MKTTIGVYEAKTQFSRLIDRVEGGERIVISRNGIAVAELRPLERTALTPDEAVATARAIRALQSKVPGTLRNPGETLRGLAHEGHRH